MKNSKALLSLLLLLISTTVFSQVLTTVEPDSAIQCQQLTITVTGENTNFYQGTSALWLQLGYSSINPATTNVISPTEIEGEFFFSPDNAAGIYDVHAYNGGGSGDMVIPEGFTLSQVDNQPQLINSVPDTAITGDTIVIIITAEYTHFDSPNITNVVKLRSNVAQYLHPLMLTEIDSESIEASFYINPNLQIFGNYDLYVSNQLDGNLILSDALYIINGGNTPEIISVDPNSAYQGEELKLTVTGTNTLFQQGSTSLRLYKPGAGVIDSENQYVVNDSIIEGDFIFNSDHDTGLYNIEVVVWGLTGVMSLQEGFHLLSEGESPYLLSVNPSSTKEGTRVILIIKAKNTHFDMAGNTPSVTLIQGYEELYCQDIVVIDSVTLEANFVFSYENYLGYHDLEVYAPLDGTLILEDCFDLIESEPNASIVSVNPDSAYIDDQITISVTGKNIIFMQGTSNLSLKQGSLSISPINQEIINDTTITGKFSFLNTFPTGKYDVNIDNWYAWPAMNLQNGFTLELFDFIDESDKLTLLTVYPNPSDGFLTIKRNFGSGETYHLTVFSQSGNITYNDELLGDETIKKLNLTHLKPGSYYLKIKGDNNEQVSSFIIK